MKTDEELVAWVSEGVNASPSPAFQTDGIMYLFSALRPEPPPASDLRLWAIDERWLAVLVFTPLIVIGLLLLKSSFGSKILAIASVVIGVVACGIFVPTFARQMLNQPMYASLTIVVVAWAAWYLSLFVVRFDGLLGQPKNSRPRFQPEPPVAPVAPVAPVPPSGSSSQESGSVGGDQNG